jgi:hypothetical protein
MQEADERGYGGVSSVKPRAGQAIARLGRGCRAIVPVDVHDLQFAFRKILGRRSHHVRILLFDLEVTADNWLVNLDNCFIAVLIEIPDLVSQIWFAKHNKA